jgi:hypothetical protein
VALTKNTAGQMYALTVLTPIIAERLPALETILANLPQPSPFRSNSSQPHISRGW